MANIAALIFIDLH